jgi:hypothetical protein
MYGKSITEKHKLLISQAISKSIYLYDANSFSLIAKYSNQKDLIKELGIAPKTILKYRDSGKVFREKYIITSKPIGDSV